MLYELRYRLARSDAPIAISARNLLKKLRRFSLPLPHAVARALLAVLIGLRRVYFTLLRILVCEPLFKGYCTTYGRNLRTGVHFHWVDGAGEIVVGDDAWIYGKSSFLFQPRQTPPPRLTIGDRTQIGHGCVFRVADSVTIGDDCILSADVFIFDNPGYPTDPQLRLARIPWKGREVRRVIIGNNVWIGARATICHGVSIGDNSIVATGAVVMTNVAPNCVVSGNPARKVQDLTPPDKTAASSGIGSEHID